MSTILICPADHAKSVAAEHDPFHILALAAPGDAVPEIAAPHRLPLAFHDIAETRPGLVAPGADAVAALIAFGRSWDGAAPFLVHCRMGISRSTAAAMILAALHRPDRSERALAEALRAAAPCATPNPLMIALADAALGREGRLIAAVAAIGRGADYRPYRKSTLTLER